MNLTSHLFFEQGEIRSHFEEVETLDRPAVFPGLRLRVSPTDDATRFGKSGLIGKQDNVLAFSRIPGPRLKGLITIAIGDASMIHGEIGLSRKTPLSYMGEGMSRLL